MNEQTPTTTLAGHLKHLAADLDDVVAMLNAQHDEGGDIQPEALPKAAALNQSLKDIVYALTHHDHLAMKADDVWGLLSVKHKEHDTGVS